MQHLKAIAAGAVLTGASLTAQAGEWSANFTAANNYLWRGLTQSTNEPAMSGGIDWAHESGLYIGTWVSNVDYANATPASGSGDTFNYEHDLYIGFAGEFGNGLSYDIGYLYYNYDESADFDFGEIYGSLAYGGFSFTAYVFAHTEAKEYDSTGDGIVNLDFDFGNAFYLSFDYGTTIGNGVDIGLHLGYHDGDFVDGFNFGNGTDSYLDFAASVSKGGFGFMVSTTDVDDSEDTPGLQNGEVKYVVSYSVDFEL